MLWSEIPSGICARLRTVAASNNRVIMACELCCCLFVPHICMVLFFTHIPFVVNHTINATPPERLQQSTTLHEVGCFMQSKSTLSTEKSYAGWHNIKQGCQATCIYVTVEFGTRRSQGGVGLQYFHDLWRKRGWGVKKLRLRPPLLYMGGSGLDRTDDFQNIFGTGLDLIQ